MADYEIVDAGDDSPLGESGYQFVVFNAKGVPVAFFPTRNWAEGWIAKKVTKKGAKKTR